MKLFNTQSGKIEQLQHSKDSHLNILVTIPNVQSPLLFSEFNASVVAGALSVFLEKSGFKTSTTTIVNDSESSDLKNVTLFNADYETLITNSSGSKIVFTSKDDMSDLESVKFDIALVRSLNSNYLDKDVVLQKAEYELVVPSIEPGGVSFTKLLEENYGIEECKYYILMHNRSAVTQFNWESIKQAVREFNAMKEFCYAHKPAEAGDESYDAQILNLLEDNFNTSEVLKLCQNLILDDKVDNGAKSASLYRVAELIGFNFSIPEDIEYDEEVTDLIAQRAEAIDAGDQDAIDDVESQLADLGYEIVSTYEGDKLIEQ